MNAPTSIRPDPARVEDAYRASITIHCPNEDELTLANRVALAALRDQSSAALRRCSPATAPVLMEISRIASFAVFAPMPPGQVHMTRFALANLMEGARILERAVNWKARDDA